MPIVHLHKEKYHTLAVWSSVEPESSLRQYLRLGSSEMALLEGVSSPTRRREILTVRRLLLEVCGPERKLMYDKNGKPLLDNGACISISHSRDHVALIVSEQHPVGIDIEALRPQISSLSKKFIAEDEKIRWGDRLDEPMMHLIWGAKEVLFKLYAKGGIDFKTDLLVEPAENDDINAVLTRPDSRFSVPIRHRLLDGFMLVWAVKQA